MATIHKAQAEAHLKLGLDPGFTSAAPLLISAALVEATLYLAEQQRIGNIIAARTPVLHPNGDVITAEDWLGTPEFTDEIRSLLGLA